MTVTEARALKADLHAVQAAMQSQAEKVGGLDSRVAQAEKHSTQAAADSRRAALAMERTAEILERQQQEQHEMHLLVKEMHSHRLREEGAAAERKKARDLELAAEKERRETLGRRLAAIEADVRTKADAEEVATLAKTVEQKADLSEVKTKASAAEVKEQGETLKTVRDWSLRTAALLSIAGTVGLIALGWAVSDVLGRLPPASAVQVGER